MKKYYLFLVLLSMLAGIGCSPNKIETAAPPSTPLTENPDTTDATTTTTGGGTGGGLTSKSSGDTVTFTPVDLETFNDYVGTHPLNSPKNIKIAVNLKNNGSLRFYGSVKIFYEDTGKTWTGLFESQKGKNTSIDSLKDNDVMVSVFNYWFKKDSNVVFSGLYQDDKGAIVLVVDKTLDQGDGQGGGYVSGSVYFRNFAQSKVPQSSYRKCWFIYDGPYDCRTETVMKKTGLYPTEDEGYRKLGTFSGLSKNKAFNLE